MTHARPVDTRGNEPIISTGYSTAHPGIDYAYPAGTPLYSTADGKIVFVKSNETRKWIANSPSDPYLVPGVTRRLTNADYGNYMIVDHGEGHRTLYAHLLVNSPKFGVGGLVKKGQKIAEIGSTGNSTGNHVHFELIINGVKSRLSDNFDSEFNNYYDGGTMAHTIESLMAELAECGKHKDSLQEQVNGWLRDTQNGKYVLGTDVAIKEKAAYDRGFADGKASVPINPINPTNPTQPDPSHWEENGMDVEVTIGNVKTITNYSRKSIALET